MMSHILTRSLFMVPEMHIVSSSTIAAIGYDARRHELHVRFHGIGLYVYQEVAADLFDEFLDSSSKGTFFNKHVKGRYEFIAPSSSAP